MSYSSRHIIYKVILLAFVKYKVVKACSSEVFMLVTTVDVDDCLSVCEKEPRCSTYYYRDDKYCSKDKTKDNDLPGDPCDTGNHNCSVNANCTASSGTFRCACVKGYQGDGVTCERVCKFGWKKFNGSCYQLYTDTKTWNSSVSFCKTKQADLMSIHSLEENSFGWSLMRKGRCAVAWIGLARSGNPPSLYWSDGSSFKYHKWYFREPNNSGQCVYMRVRDSKWKIHDCTRSLAFICKS